MWGALLSTEDEQSRRGHRAVVLAGGGGRDLQQASMSPSKVVTIDDGVSKKTTRATWGDRAAAGAPPFPQDSAPSCFFVICFISLVWY